MTLELTLEQLHFIRAAVQTRLDGCNAAALALWDAPPATKTVLTTITLHQP